MIMPFGKYKGLPLKSIPFSYLRWVLDNCDRISLDLKIAIVQTLNQQPQHEEHQNNQERQKYQEPKKQQEHQASQVNWEEVVKKWHRTLMMRHHPDRGGTNEAMHLIDQAKKLLEQLIQDNTM